MLLSKEYLDEVVHGVKLHFEVFEVFWRNPEIIIKHGKFPFETI